MLCRYVVMVGGRWVFDKGKMGESVATDCSVGAARLVVFRGDAAASTVGGIITWLCGASTRFMT